MGTPRKASSPGPRKWSENGSTSRAKMRNFKLMMFTGVKLGTGLASQRGSRVQSKRAKQRNLARIQSRSGGTG